MQKTVNVTHIIEKFSEKVKPYNWGILDYFMKRLEFIMLTESLAQENNLGYRFTPKYIDVFNGIINCPPTDVKVMIIGQDPYPQPNVADGIAFSCSKTGKEQPSLTQIFDKVEKLYPEGYDRDPNLLRWCKQGVVMINSALTCRVNEVGSHYHIWKEFMVFFLGYMNKLHPDCITVLMGKKARNLQEYIPNHKVIKVSHPASAVYNGGNWDDKDLFRTVNKMLVDIAKEPINW